MLTRRKFMAALSAIGLGAGIPFQSKSNPQSTMIVHQVFFWLHHPEKDMQAVWEGCKKIASTKSVKDYQLGKPAGTTRREVVDHSFHISLTVYFDNLEAHDLYQTDPIHLAFVDDHKDKWSQVKVYDFEV
ncbi:Dabb family protein [Cyclobacterium salsum]|uniref:Dabb family protein n=1 Tax=Cyclobacterium salsum TaxID=2666329 RepID=UPI0013908C39|nr:Dabb family protein [Cyclobacterium salsum]